MRIGKKLLGAIGGVVIASLVASLFPQDQAEARAKRKRRKGGAMRLLDLNVDDFAGVPLNRVVRMTFTRSVDPGSVNEAVIRIRSENANSTGFSIQVPGDFQVVSNKINFYPRLPTHRRDDDGEFYPIGSAKDDANENAGFQPSTDYEITIIGHPRPSPVRAKGGRKLARSVVRRFTTAPGTPKHEAFDLGEYVSDPPPAAQFTNPPDKVANAIDQYAVYGGTQEVPADIAVTLFGSKVPLSPNTVRQGDNVQLSILERRGDPSVRKPVQGNPFVEQNYDTARLDFVPRFPLADVGIYALRLKRDVHDLTELFDYAESPERLRLREVYDFLDTARLLSPNTPCEMLTDPPVELITDWLLYSPAERGVLKCNLLDLGDNHPDEIDPRVQLIFTTRDEPISDGEIAIEFNDGDGFYDDKLSTGRWDENVPGAASATLTIAGGSGVDGDYNPFSDDTIDLDAVPGGEINWRNVNIPPGVTVSFTGTRPAVIKAFKFNLEGEMHVDGAKGGDGKGSNSRYYTSYPSAITVLGGAGAPGGGRGGAAKKRFPSSNDTVADQGENGYPGIDSNGTPAIIDVGGQGGAGGKTTVQSSAYVQGGGGGGGGGKTAGTKGDDGKWPQYNWDGKGGIGGMGSSNDELNPLVGAAGGGAGGNGGYTVYGWGVIAGGGGGAGGGILIQTPDFLRIGTNGLVSAHGGNGGKGFSYSAMSGGPGGAGGGGSILLRSTRGFDIADPTRAFDVSGGSGGPPSTNSGYEALFGGNGGSGYVRLEDPEGGLQLPGFTAGDYNPVGGGVPSIVYTTFIDVGVDNPRFVNFAEDDFVMSASANDAVLIEIQMAIEDSTAFGSPKTDAIQPDQNSIDETEVSQWIPVRVFDNTGTLGGAFGDIPGYDPGIRGNDYIFPVADQINDKDFKFFRYRITFQLDDSQTTLDPFPYVDRLVLNFQFNN